MYYFIPAWYNNDNNRPWYHDTRLWFRMFERMTFDDTVNQIKMFHRAEEDVQLLVLSYQPHFRYFLHKQGLLGTSYWSFFDDIQHISDSLSRPISFKELNWPEGTQFLYSPFAVVARRDGIDFATIHFAENGNLFYIEFMKEGHRDKQYLFDDRGFLSSILYYDESGNESHQDYLNANGVWQVREYLHPDAKWKIEVNAVADLSFNNRFYKNWVSLILERLILLKKSEIATTDKMVIACHEQHNSLLLNVFEEHQKVLSLFGDRFSYSKTVATKELLIDSDILVVDTQKQENQLMAFLDELGIPSKKLSRISPFDTRLRLGHSQMIKEMIIYFYIDTISEDTLKTALKTILEVMDANDDVNLSLITFEQGRSLKNLEEWLSQRIKQKYDIEKFFEVSNEGENQLEEDETLELSRIQLNCFTNENEIIRALDTARLVIDLGNEPDLYTQIASISAGVPQINSVLSDYVSHKQNGWIVTEEASLKQALHYYLDGLSNWNASLVYSTQKMGDYTSGRILEQWKVLLERE